MDTLRCQIKYYITNYNFIIEMSGLWNDLAALQAAIGDVQTALDSFDSIVYYDPDTSQPGRFFKVTSSVDANVEYQFQVEQLNVAEATYIIRFTGIV